MSAAEPVPSGGPPAVDPSESRRFADLLDRAAHGDMAATGALAEQYERHVRLVARVMLGRAMRPYVDSVDLVQSVHHSVLLGIRDQRFEITDPQKLTALAVTVVRRKVARHWRRLKRQQRLSGAGPADGSDGPTGADGLLAAETGSEPDPSHAMQTREQIERLCRDLSDTDRRLLELRMEDLPTAVIAERMGLSPVALRVRLTRLRQRLQDEHVAADWL